MKRLLQAALAAAGLAALMGQAGAADMRLPPSLTAFGATGTIAPPSAAGLPVSALRGPAARNGQDALAGEPLTLHTSFGTASLPRGFVASVALSAHLAVDTGYDVDLTQRFGNYDGAQSPLISENGFLALASGGHYAGATYMPTSDVHLRLGATEWSDRADRLGLLPTATGLPLAYDNGYSRSLLAGATWDIASWADLGVSALHNTQRIPDPVANLGTGSRVDTDALEMMARLKLGNGWVTTAAYGQGLSQLDQRSQASSIDTRSYSIAIAKHGLFGEDALGLALSRPALGLPNSGFNAVSTSGNLPPLFIANDRFPSQTQETDLQLGYITSFMDGALALQANASYQMNYQGQTGATSVSLLSRAKIKF